ncbi:RraA family protein [Vibrio sp. JC009]|uniref:RraA family protein n=1 Tax=Vibrio sp. JC009 TaxID=2912314 RepID=UPI0023B0BAF9|nr:RraA family protein [Vibrio sp. JC009]WED24043.1 RraA family protein [Vibrio sp. JC009]
MSGNDISLCHDTLQSSFNEKMECLKQLGTATIYEAQGATGALDSNIKPLHGDMRFAGPAYTVDMRPADNLMVHYAMLRAHQGDILVLDAKGFVEAGPWGDVLTSQAMHMGLSGLLINGAVRDSSAIIDMGFPVFSKGLSIKSTGKSQIGKVEVPVYISGVEINSGDIVVGDRDGVVVVKRHRLDEVIELSLKREEKETEFVKQIKSGATTANLLNLEDKLFSIQTGN